MGCEMLLWHVFKNPNSDRFKGNVSYNLTCAELKDTFTFVFKTF